jgi:pyrimidine operon attenuation protein/uracil phosphoribosyltransferase
MDEIANPDQLLEKLAADLKQLLDERNIDDPLMVGIHTGGAWIANTLHAKLGIARPLATLDISFYRDDFSRIGMNPKVKPSSLPPQVEDKHIILVDDVLQTGRTIRAAMNEIFDYGRPASITLVCLVDRSGRELPIQADIVGQHLQLGPKQHIKLSGPEPLDFIVT